MKDLPEPAKALYQRCIDEQLSLAEVGSRLQQPLVKTGGRLVEHARYCWLTLAESPLTRRLFGGMVVEINQQNGSRRLGRPSPGLGRSLLGIVRKLTDYKKEIEKEKQLEVYYQGPEGP